MPILIDGHNLIGQLPTISLEDPDDEEKLARLLSAYQARTRKAITVVFDPGGAYALPKRRQLGGVKIVFAPHGSSADRVILQRVQRLRNPSEWLVITSDRELSEAVGRLGARVQSAGAFASELTGPGEAPPDWRESSLSPDEIDSWLALFEGRDQEQTGDSV
jgi:predicted RNA-binding protein with PIN domain